MAWALVGGPPTAGLPNHFIEEKKAWVSSKMSDERRSQSALIAKFRKAQKAKQKKARSALQCGERVDG